MAKVVVVVTTLLQELYRLTLRLTPGDLVDSWGSYFFKSGSVGTPTMQFLFSLPTLV